MARIVTLKSRDQIKQAISEAGYSVIVCIQQHDLPSSLIASQCARYSREYQFVRFYFVDISARGGAELVQYFGLSYIPTLVFYCSGKKINQIVGTDYPTIERLLKSSRVNGMALLAPK